MEHIIVLPYWCEKEVNNFLQILNRWELFCQTKETYRFLIARRFDAQENADLINACKKHAPAESISCDRYPWVGWPAGANGMFKHVMETINEKPNDGGFVYWFEHDVIPIYIDWMDWLAKMWKPELSVLGQYMSPPWINLHQMPMNPNVNGTACYNKRLASNPAVQMITQDKCFDFTLSELVPAHGGKIIQLPLLYDLWFMMPDWVGRCDLTKLMINGIKEINQREIVIQYILKNRD